MRASIVAVILAGMTLVTHARASEAPCRALYRGEDVPRGLEGTYFVSTGVASTNAGKHPAVVGVGLELTMPVLGWTGFPSGYGSDRSSLRTGGFIHATTRTLGSGLEGGVIFDVSSRYHASWGTFTLRGGVGYGALPDDRQSYAVVTAIYGVRSVLAHHSREGACRHGSTERPLAEASVVRLFGTLRRAFADNAHELVLGIELSPTFFWPPISWWRLAGGPPR